MNNNEFKTYITNHKLVLKRCLNALNTLNEPGWSVGIFYTKWNDKGNYFDISLNLQVLQHYEYYE